MTPFVKLVEVVAGDTLLLADGEEWILPDGLRYILIEETAQVLPTGDREVRVGLQQLKVRAKKARGHRR